MITDQNGNEISRMAFDPFGKRLTEHVGSSVLSQDAANDSSYHGYTGHSQLDHLGLVHMGGRVYDPDSGRFLSADLFVQSPYNTQSYNRYSYVFNNPLRNTDPSGYLSREDEAKKAPEEVLVLGHRISQQSNSLNMSLGFMSLFSSANSSFGGLPSGMISGFGITSKMDRYIGKLGVRARNGDIGAMQALQNIRKQQKALQKKLRTGGLNGEGLSLGVQKGNGYGVTDEQRQLVADGKIQEFWESRLAAGDPVARAGLASLNPEGGVVDYLFGGTSINNRLQAFANVYADGALNIDQVRVDLATAHINFTDGDRLGVRGLLNPGQIAEYHHQVFDRHGLPPTTFGGTPFTGAVGEAWATRPVWCGGCDWK